MVRIPRRRAPREVPQDEADEFTAELSDSYWQAYDERMSSIGFFTMARRFPGLIGQALRLAGRPAGGDDLRPPSS